MLSHEVFSRIYIVPQYSALFQNTLHVTLVNSKLLESLKTVNKPVAHPVAGPPAPAPQQAMAAPPAGQQAASSGTIDKDCVAVAVAVFVQFIFLAA